MASYLEKVMAKCFAVVGLLMFCFCTCIPIIFAADGERLSTVVTVSVNEKSTFGNPKWWSSKKILNEPMLIPVSLRTKLKKIWLRRYWDFELARRALDAEALEDPPCFSHPKDKECSILDRLSEQARILSKIS